MDIDLQLVLQTFLAESEEGLSAMEEALVALESRPEDEEALGTIFRVAHTLKGNAGSLDFPAVAEFAHVLEDVLDQLRRRTLAVTSQLVTLLLRSVDALRQMVPDAVSGIEGMQPAHKALLQRLAEVQGTARAVDPGRGQPGQLQVPEGPGGVERRRSQGRRKDDHERDRTLRVDMEKLDRMLDLTGEIAIARGRLKQVLEGRGGRGEEILEAHQEMDRLCMDLQELVMKARMVPLGPVFRQHIRTVRDVATAHGKQARLVIEGEEVEVDTSIIEHIRDPLTHMVRNALDHGIELPEARRRQGKDPCGRLTLRAYHDAGSIVIQLADDGAGLDRERITARARPQGATAAAESLTDQELHRLVFEPGFSTAKTVTHLSGRGIGLDVVRRNVELLGGSVGIESQEGVGTTITLRLPLTLAIIAGFAVGAGSETYVIPLDTVVECIELPKGESPHADGRGVINLRGEPLPYLGLRELFAPGSAVPAREHVVVVRNERGHAGLVVDTLHGESQAVIKPLGRLFQGLPGIAGSTILGNGRVALILDPLALFREASSRRADPVPSEPDAAPMGSGEGVAS